MDAAALQSLLEKVRDGSMPVSAAADALRDLPYQDLGYARLDHHRPLRTGWPEVVLGQGKTPQQVAGIVDAMAGRGHPVLVTRAPRETYDAVAAVAPSAEYHTLARCIVIPDCAADNDDDDDSANAGVSAPAPVEGTLIVTAGTADLPAAAEAALTATLMGCPPRRINDVGVAGLHRLLSQLDALRAARVIVVVAGMEAALASVVAGLVSAPVIAVPTGAGYGASFGGLAALLGMLNACAPGVAVVNIDNGFGAGYLAAQLCRMAAQPAAVSLLQ